MITCPYTRMHLGARVKITPAQGYFEIFMLVRVFTKRIL
jgi:hypothetical protein